MIKNFLITIVFYFLFLAISSAEIINKVEIEGNKRISKETIILFGDIEIEKNYSPEQLNEIIIKLYDTGFFSNIEINIEENLLKRYMNY